MTRFGLFHGVLSAWLIAGPHAAPARAEAVADGVADPAQVQAQVQAQAALLSQSDREIYTEALLKAAGRRFDEARDLAGTARDPLLAKVILWLDLSEIRPGGSFPVVATFLTKNPRWPGQGSLRLHAEMILPEDLPDAQVLAWFDAHAPLSAEGAMRHAEALTRAGERDRAITLLRTTWIERIVSGQDERAFLKRFGALLRPADDLARLDRLLWDRQFRPAKRQAHRLGGGYGALAEARLLLAHGRPGVDTAIKRVPAALQDDPGLIYERARWRQQRRHYEGVIELLDPPNAAAPNPERWWRLRHWAVRQALLKGDISVAYRIASRHGMNAGLGFAEAEWLAGWIALRFLDDPRTAYRHFTRLHEGVFSPVSLGRGAFWAGEAARALDAKAPLERWQIPARHWYEAAAAHDTSFYGQLASRRLGRDPVIDLNARSAPGDEARAAFEAEELVRIVRMLGEVGETKLQEQFMARLGILAETGEDHALVAELANRIGRPDLAMRTARAARSEGVILPGYLFPSVPLPETDLPERALLLALIRQESGFYPEAVSPAGARGLMQIMPGTARQVARRIQIAYNGAKLLSDPDYNVLLGRTYLSDLLERYGGSYVLALAAYNAGPARASGWIDAFGDPRDPEVDVIDWIESIPIDETRNYVQRILESLVAYRQQLGVSARRPGGLPELSRLTPLPTAEPDLGEPDRSEPHWTEPHWDEPHWVEPGTDHSCCL